MKCRLKQKKMKFNPKNGQMRLRFESIHLNAECLELLGSAVIEYRENINLDIDKSTMQMTFDEEENYSVSTILRRLVGKELTVVKVGADTSRTVKVCLVIENIETWENTIDSDLLTFPVIISGKARYV